MTECERKNGIAAAKEAVGQFPDQPTLELMTRQALNVLSKNNNGFFLMIEAGSSIENSIGWIRIARLTS